MYVNFIMTKYAKCELKFLLINILVMSFWKRIKSYYSENIQGSWQILSVLLWRNVKDHQHSCIGGLWRIFQGCSVFLALLSVRLSLLPSDETENTQNARDYNTIANNKILFSPRNYMTERIMKSVQNELKWMNSASVSGTPFVSWEFDFYDDKDSLSNDPSEIIIMVNFKDAEAKDQHFNYSITSLIQKQTSEKDQPLQEFLNALQPIEEDLSPIMGWLQWAIDKSYIERSGKHKVTQELKIYHRSEYIPKYISLLQSFIHLCIIIAPLPFFLNAVSRLSRKKKIGLEQLLKLSGISHITSHIADLLDTIVVATIYAVIITFILKVSANPILPYSNPVILVISIVLYYINVHSLAFVTSTISSDYNYAGSMAMLVYICTALVALKWFTQEITAGTTRIIVCCFLIHAPMFMFWDEVTFLESLGRGANFSEIFVMHGYRLPIPIIWVLLLMHTSLMMFLDWYLDKVIPSSYGSTEKWSFIFQRKVYRRKKKKAVNFHVTAEQNVRVLRDSRYFEEGPKNVDVVVKTVNLTKKYVLRKKTVVALDKICLDMYRGEVTVVLGSHASGKSSLLTIISGMQSATSGTVYVNGMDNVARLNELKDIVAFSPQQSTVFRNLTVRENIIFYEKLKKKATQSITDILIENLQLSDHYNLLSEELPKELLKCLQIACAVVTGADILIFDNFTLGMGIETRHRVWNLVMELRGVRTIIISTTNLEEASMLGDRIAILNKGKVRCYGSPSFLSEAIGIGLNLTITLSRMTHLEELLNLVVQVIPEVKSQTRGSNGLTIMLPQEQRNLFVQLIETLEAKKKEFGITTIDVEGPLEAVYQEFIDTFNDEELIVVPSDFGGSLTEERKQWVIVKSQFRCLILRVYHYVWIKKYQYIFLQVILPILGIILVTVTTNQKFGYTDFVHLRTSVNTLLLDIEPIDRNSAADIVTKYGFRTSYSKNVEEDLDNLSVLPEEAVGLSISKNLTKIFILEDPTILSKSLNMYSNLYMKLRTPISNKTIDTSYKAIKRQRNIVEPKHLFLCLNWACWICFLSMLPLAPFVMLAIIERSTRSRDIHMMAGCHSVVHWCSKLLAYMSIYVVTMPLAVVLAAVMFDYDKTINNKDFLGVLILILLFFAAAFLAKLQFLSFIFTQYYAIGHIYFMSLEFGLLATVLTNSMSILLCSIEAIGLAKFLAVKEKK